MKINTHHNINEDLIRKRIRLASAIDHKNRPVSRLRERVRSMDHYIARENTRISGMGILGRY